MAPMRVLTRRGAGSGRACDEGDPVVHHDGKDARVGRGECRAARAWDGRGAEDCGKLAQGKK